MATDAKILDAPPAPLRWAMGLGEGWVAKIANISAVGLICVMFWSNNRDMMTQARQDRESFRLELDRTHDDLHRLSDDIRGNQTAIQQNQKALESMIDELKRVRRFGQVMPVPVDELDFELPPDPGSRPMPRPPDQKGASGPVVKPLPG